MVENDRAHVSLFGPAYVRSLRDLAYESLPHRFQIRLCQVLPVAPLGDLRLGII